MVDYILYTFVFSLVILMLLSYRSTPKDMRKNGKVMLENMLSDVFFSALIAFLLGSIIYVGVKTFSEGITFGSNTEKDNITMVSKDAQVLLSRIY